MKLEAIETDALHLLIERSGEHAECHSARLELALFGKLSFSGTGFFREILMPETAPVFNGEPNLFITGVGGTVRELRNGVGFLLIGVHGRMSVLEVFCYGENWPDKITDYSLEIENY